ncbi:beta-glucosidase [Nibricoccus aquaticus]|uniref:Beta-glucosidase n=2 Tax=Nibricoccus aquaticus TaxID=2576891 RepID=A0A290QBE2_9BACT|nr:beta-glucosidase [Nibricoccus aquaticus]
MKFSVPSASCQFPASFAWGVATAAPQIEGAFDADGKSPSIWDVFSRKPGATHNGDTLDVACDHYHRYEADLDLMAALGMKHYRLSIAWPRIIPTGAGTLNTRGVDFYNRLIDASLKRGITPWVTMFHWDLPQVLEDKGGWPERVVVDAFADYADEIVKAYGDRVKNWITLNEIGVFLENGYGVGRHAPGRKEKPEVVNQAFHHAMLCHGHGVRAVREHGGKDARVGLTDNSRVTIPLTETAPDIEAAHEQFARRNARILEPMYRGEYGKNYLAHTKGWLPKIAANDFELIAQPTDFLGLNIYSGEIVRRGADGGPQHIAYPENFPTADSPWLKLNARCMYWGPRLAAEVFGAKDVVITESGAGYNDLPPVKGEVFDIHRLEYIRACLRELRRSIADGVPVSGYFAWSFMDNFEWADGYDRRFGIVYTDFKTQVRTPKASGRWYSQVVRENALV